MFLFLVFDKGTFCFQTQMTTVKMLSLGSLSNIIHTLIPDFPTIESMNVSETIINEVELIVTFSISF